LNLEQTSSYASVILTIQKHIFTQTFA